MRNLKYNPLYSFIRYLHLVMTKRIRYPLQNIGKEASIKNSGGYKIFLEIDIINKDRKPKRGQAIFKVIFHSPTLPVETIIKRTRYTVPFFSGLPGFCTKQFMVNKKERTFSGRYEWETIEMAKKYARSYALVFMKRRSEPLPIYYEIFDKHTRKVIEATTLENQ